ncbi:MAG: dockerin type I repeat-containing protein, partial [Saprospiraceae bacterium]
EGYKVFKRWEARTLPRVYPSGNMNQASNSIQNYQTWLRNNQVDQRSPSGNWVEIGPLSKPSGYDAGVGRVDFVKFSPTNSNVMYVSTPDGGLWKTTNGNDALPTWTTYNDFLPVIGCSDLAIAPDGVTMYLATGSWESDKRSIGILKSVDGGVTWTTTGLTWALSDNYKIRRLIMDPTNPLVMMAATDGGVFRTTNGWDIMTPVLSPQASINGNYNVDDLKFKSGSSSIVYASGRTGGKVFLKKSTNNGVDWSDASSGLPVDSTSSRVIMGLTAANADYIYVLIGNSDSGYYGTYRSADSGATFTERISDTEPKKNILNTDFPPPLLTENRKGQASHDLAIVISPTNADSLMIGGINQYRSTNGGKDWQIVTYWYGTDPLVSGGTPDIAPYMHADVQSITYAPGSSTVIYSTSDGGISRSTNSGVSWTDLSNNLRVAQMTDMALSSNDAIMSTGLQDIGNLKNTGGVWTYIGGGDGESTFIDRTNNNNIVTSDPNGDHSVSTNGGTMRTSLNKTPLPTGTEFFSPIIQDPVTSTTCYAGGRVDLWKSTDYLSAPSHTWTSIGTPVGDGSVLRFVVAPSNPNIIYTLKEKTVSKTTDGGANWTDVTGTGMDTLPVNLAYIKNITISNTDPNKVWVVFSGYSLGNKVFKTVNGGTSWTNISGTLPNIPFNTILFRNGSSNDEVYIGGDIGVYVTNNALAGTWKSFSTGLANSTVNDLEIYYPTGKLRAATYGRGAWESNLYTGDPTVLVDIKVYLEGPYNTGTGKMNDGLRSSNYLPTRDPYPSLGYTHVGGEIEGTNSARLINTDTDNAIVDWIWVELRSSSDPTVVLYTRSALVQRDGDVVDMDGVSLLHFSNAVSGNYYVAVRHRNHLGFRTLDAIALGASSTPLNFSTNSVPTYGTNALKSLGSGKYGMYAGDANGDGQVNAADLNDQWKGQNGNAFNYLTTRADFNMDGVINASDLNDHWKPNNSRAQQLD